MAMIEVSKLNKSYGSFQALKDVDLQVTEGEVVVVLGPSGSGKSTLIRCMNLLENFEGGTICINEHRVQKGPSLSTIRSEVGMVFQSFNLFPHMSARANVALAPMRVRKISRSEAERRADALLAKVGLADHAEKLPSQLSGGQQQRVADRVVFMEAGRVVETNTPEAFFTAPREERTRLFLDAILKH